MKFQLSFKGTVRERLDAITSMCNLLAQQMFYGRMKDQENLNAITFVTLTESGAIDSVTASEHVDAFDGWHPSISYKAGNIRVRDGKLWKCIQDHTSQDDWKPEDSPSLWVNISDPAEEWPAWSQPVGAHDAYSAGDKVSHNGKHWISTADSNVWEPGVYGWEESSE